jgi:hypothetical protein
MGARNAFLRFPFRWRRFRSGRRPFVACADGLKLSNCTVDQRLDAGIAWIHRRMQIEHAYDRLVPVAFFEVDGTELSASRRASVTLGDTRERLLSPWFNFSSFGSCGGPLRRQERHSHGLGGGSRSCLRNSGLAQAVNDALPSGDRSRIVARRTGEKSRDAECRVDRKSCPSLRARFREQAQTR